MIAAEIQDLIWAAPIAFLIGVVAGLAVSSRWLIVRRERAERKARK